MQLRNVISAAVLAGSATIAMGNTASAAVYNIDFGPNGSTVTPGYFNYNVGAFNSVASPSLVIGDGITLSFTNVNNYSLPNPNNPLVTDGIFAATVTPSAFALSGLTAGSTVTLYAISTWDDNAAAGFVSLGGGPIVDTAPSNNGNWTSTTPGTSPTVSDFVLVNSNVAVGGTGTLTGFISRTNGTITREGQIGGFIIDVIPPAGPAVPEPASLSLLLAASGLLARRRKM